MRPRILFVCTANRFRSLIAAAAFTRRLEIEELSADVDVESAGTWANEGETAYPSTAWMAENTGLDVAEHRSRPITREILSGCTLAVVMEKNQKEALQHEFADLAERVHLLSEIGGGAEYDIPDPVTHPGETLEGVADEILKLVDARFKEIYRLSGAE